jgi:hypothetical protein
MSRRRVIWSVIAPVTLIVIGMGAFVSVRLLGEDEPAEAALISPSGAASQAGSSTESRGSGRHVERRHDDRFPRGRVGDVRRLPHR